tara:strand:+ start:71 stop:1600 length:1530 start_codon:yes stop_codon:yes gene_type:complete
MKYFKIFLTVVFLLLLLKTDYRFNEININSVGDDSEYYYNVITLVQDFDLDYSNQLDINSPGIYKNGSFVAPAHPIGNGFLAFPFLLISNYILTYFYSPVTTSINYFIYSLVPIFYLFLSISLLVKVIGDKYKNLIILSIFGSGVTYFAFERFSMSIVYEFFAVTLLIYLSGNKLNKYKYFLIGFLPSFFLLIRTSSYHYFLIPILILILNDKEGLKKFLLRPYLAGITLGVSVYSLISKVTYGIVTFTPTTSFNATNSTYYKRLSSLLDINLLGENIVLTFNTLKNVFFGFEFGLVYFSPILAITVYLVWKLLTEKKYLCLLMYSTIFIIPFAQILIIQSIGFSYGFRYLYNLIPLNLYLLFKVFKINKKILIYLIIFSINGILSTLFFETSEFSSLSEDYSTNMFGNYERYANKDYLIGYLKSFLFLNSYIKIVLTSFIGVILFKLIDFFYDPFLIFSKFKTLTPKEITLIENSVQYDLIYLTCIFVFFLYMSILFFKTIPKTKSKL